MGRTGHVVLIDIDGFSPSYLDRVAMPNLRELARRGSLTIATGTYRAISNPNRFSLATGAYPATHQNAAYIYDPVLNKIVGQSRACAVENVGEALVRQGRRLAAAGWYVLENRGATYGDPDALYTQHACLENFDTAVKIIRGEPVDSGGCRVTVGEPPDFIAIYCADVDTLGHRGGPDNPEIAPLLERIDTAIGSVVQATRDANIYDDTTFIVLSDHGSTGYTTTVHDALLAKLSGAGYRAEILSRGGSPRRRTEVVIAQAIRAGAVYLRGRADTDLDRVRLRRLFQSMLEIENVLDKDDHAALRAAPAEGDFTIEARAPYSFGRPGRQPPPGTEYGTHVTLADMKLPLVIAGRGIRRDALPHEPRSIDVIPTVCRLLGVEPPGGADGRVLDEILTRF